MDLNSYAKPVRISAMRPSLKPKNATRYGTLNTLSEKVRYSLSQATSNTRGRPFCDPTPFSLFGAVDRWIPNRKTRLNK